MGNAAYQKQNLMPQLLQAKSTQNLHAQSDYRSQARRFTTVDAPWNVTQWVDPFDPHPKVSTMPVLIVVRK